MSEDGAPPVNWKHLQGHQPHSFTVQCAHSRRYLRLRSSGSEAERIVRVELMENTHPQLFDRKIAELSLPLDQLEAAIRQLNEQSGDPSSPEV